MFKRIYTKFNIATDFVTRVYFWGMLIASAISSEVTAYMENIFWQIGAWLFLGLVASPFLISFYNRFKLDFLVAMPLAIGFLGIMSYTTGKSFLLATSFFIITFISSFTLSALIRKCLPLQRHEIHLPPKRNVLRGSDGRILDEAASDSDSQEEQKIQESASTTPEYLSLQEAAILLAEKTQFTKDKLQWAARFPGRKTMQEMFWERDNPSKVHKETLDSATTIPLINLCLHMCRKMNVEICGTRPSFSKREVIPYEEIEYFDAEYKKLYLHIGRDTGSLIYNDVEVVKEDVARAIAKTNFDALISEINN